MSKKQKSCHRPPPTLAASLPRLLHGPGIPRDVEPLGGAVAVAAVASGVVVRVAVAQKSSREKWAGGSGRRAQFSKGFL